MLVRVSSWITAYPPAAIVSPCAVAPRVSAMSLMLKPN